jgi:hypothetical protein
MSAKNDGGPAFPAGTVTHYEGAPAEYTETYLGMTLRDWFAGQALAGMLALEVAVSFEDAAIDAYGYAHAMLQQREKES